jgi:bilin biosynthesis protein
VARFTRDYSQIDRVVNFLQHSSVDARRACIQDLIDSKYYQAIPQISKCPVSIVFRLRGIKLLGESGIKEGAIAFSAIAPHLDNVIRDFPDTLELVHEYDEKPSLEFLISDLYNTDFGRCYLATQTLLKEYPHELGEALLATYEKSAYNDYGAHYHVIKLLGWLKYTPGYNIVLEALNNKEPQFQKSRGAAALALANFGDFQAIPLLKEALNTRIFDLKYASLLALEQLGDLSGASIVAEDSELLIREKARTYL